MQKKPIGPPLWGPEGDGTRVAVFVTDTATNNGRKIRSHMARKVRVADHLPYWLFQTRLLNAAPTSKLKIGNLVIDNSGEPPIRIVTQGFPWTPAQMMANPKRALRALVKLLRELEAMGAEMICLGAFTAIVGDKGITLANSVKIPVISGNRLTGIMAIEAAFYAAEKMGLKYPRVAIVGAGGNVGTTACRMALAHAIASLMVVGRKIGGLRELSHVLNDDRVVEVELSKAVETADILIFATSSDQEFRINPQALKPGTIVVDMSRPRNVSERLRDIPWLLVCDGGMVTFEAEGHAGLGLPEGVYFPCYSELALAMLAGWNQNAVLPAKPEEIAMVRAAFGQFGFRLAGLRRFEQPLTDEEIEKTRRAAEERRVMLAERR